MVKAKAKLTKCAEREVYIRNKNMVKAHLSVAGLLSFYSFPQFLGLTAIYFPNVTFLHISTAWLLLYPRCELDPRC